MTRQALVPQSVTGTADYMTLLSGSGASVSTVLPESDLSGSSFLGDDEMADG